jgi:hypothetical protein
LIWFTAVPPRMPEIARLCLFVDPDPELDTNLFREREESQLKIR